MSNAVTRALLFPVVLVAIVATLGVPGFGEIGRLTAPRLGFDDQRPAVPTADALSAPIAGETPQDPLAATPLSALTPPDVVLPLSAAATDVTRSLGAPRRRGALFASLGGSFISLQALDVHSTLRAIGRGAGEANPVMAPFASHPAALIAVKAAAAGGILFMVDRIYARNRVAGVLMMAAANSAYATVVANNYRIARYATR